MKKLVYLCLATLLLLSCSNHDQFRISGEVKGLTEPTMIYLEQLTIPEVTVLDSFEVTDHFRFKAPRPENPELYQLRMGSQCFIFPIDSCEHIKIVTDSATFEFASQIEGSDNAQTIQMLRQSVQNIQKKYNAVAAGKGSSEELQQLIQQHKDTAEKVIVRQPQSIVAYFAVLQKVSGYYVFSPFNKDDRRCCAAVATAFHSFRPNYYRSKNLYAFVMSAIQEERMTRHDDQIQSLIDNADAGFLNLELPNAQGDLVSLASLKGKVVLIHFGAFADRTMSEQILDLRELYQQYHSRGLEIYQVSLDEKEDLWKRNAANLPWLCVHDAQGTSVLTYNVQDIPTFFLMNRKGEIIRRAAHPDDLDIKGEL